MRRSRTVEWLTSWSICTSRGLRFAPDTIFSCRWRILVEIWMPTPREKTHRTWWPSSARISEGPFRSWATCSPTHSTDGRTSKMREAPSTGSFSKPAKASPYKPPSKSPTGASSATSRSVCPSSGTWPTCKPSARRWSKSTMTIITLDRIW